MTTENKDRVIELQKAEIERLRYENQILKKNVFELEKQIHEAYKKKG